MSLRKERIPDREGQRSDSERIGPVDPKWLDRLRGYAAAKRSVGAGLDPEMHQELIKQFRV